VNSSTVSQLIKKGAVISFFETDGTLLGSITPWNTEGAKGLSELQKSIPRQRFAIAVAQTSIKSRLFAIEQAETQFKTRLYYEGELDLLHNSLEEMSFLIKMEEIRRLHRLTSDMYYEIMSRSIPPGLGFRRRTLRPQTDPVNAMLSFGYMLLYGSGNVAVVGSRLNPDHGFLHDGAGSLVSDLAEPLKAGMIDSTVFQIARESLRPSDYEVTPQRCMLSDDLIRHLIHTFFTKINEKKIGDQVMNLLNAILDEGEFIVLY
jgi:CRISPR-associated endonuclease Cas1